MSSPASSHQRLHDIEALRAAAMLIGIVYHAALSFARGFPWMVHDARQAKGIFVFPSWVLSPARLLCLVPLTAIPTGWMQTAFGRDTSMGIVPMPHGLLYYAVFFVFGALYYDGDDRSNRLGGGWRWSLPVTVLVVFPLALEFAEGTIGFRDALLPRNLHRPASVLLQSVFAWGMCFGSIGLFRALLTRENRLIRYLSDSSDWLYLAHLPLIIVLQSVIATWPGNAHLKLSLLSLTFIASLLVTSQYLVRYTWIGTLLNGPRKRPEKTVNAPIPA